MKHAKLIATMLTQNNGIIASKDARIRGVSNKELQRLANKGVLERVAFGLYISPDQFPDAYYITQYRCPEGIFSHETALYFHGLSDCTPFKLMLTIPSGSSTKLLKEKEDYQFYYCKNDIHKLGTITITSPFGNAIRIYDKERTICDCVKKRKSLDDDIVVSAIKQYIKEAGNDYNKLLEYADIFKVKEVIKQYMEVLI
jgi:predicted transcriptional regulator of viral defense system